MLNEFYGTGDTHGCEGVFHRLNNRSFSAGDDAVIFIAGDFGGVWDYDPRYFPEGYGATYFKVTNGDCGESEREEYTMDWLEEKPYTICFCPGNHENYDRLYRAYPQVDYYGGKARRIRKNVHMLENGELFNFDGFRVLSLGGARSHDIRDGIVEPDEFTTKSSLNNYLHILRGEFKEFRVNHLSWWEEEMPDEAMLEKFKSHASESVDLLLTHDAATFMCGYPAEDSLRKTLNSVACDIDYKNWVAGHYHTDRFLGKEMILYNKIARLA